MLCIGVQVLPLIDNTVCGAFIDSSDTPVCYNIYLFMVELPLTLLN